MAIVNIYLTPETQLLFKTYSAHFYMRTGPTFAFIASKYVGLDIQEKKYLPKTPVEVQKFMALLGSKAPANVKKAYEILIEGKFPSKKTSSGIESVHLPKWLEEPFEAKREAMGVPTRGKMGQIILNGWFNPGSNLTGPLQEVFDKLREYGLHEIPNYENLLSIMNNDDLAAVLDHPTMRKLFSEYILEAFNK